MTPDLSTPKSRLAFVTPIALKYGLEPSLVAGMCERESEWDPWAIRFEPAFERRYIHPALPAAPSTLELTKAMSFGLMQVMGEVAIEFGWKGTFLTELCDPEINVPLGSRKFQRCLLDHAGNREAALLAYNGGSNPNYPAEVIARIQKYVTP